MKRFIAAISIVVLVLLSNGALTAHAVPEHDMNTMGHGSAPISTAECLTLCSTALLKKPADERYVIDERTDDEPTNPFQPIAPAQVYALLSQELSDRAGFSAKFEPPPQLKPYIALSVFRV